MKKLKNNAKNSLAEFQAKNKGLTPPKMELIHGGELIIDDGDIMVICEYDHSYGGFVCRFGP